MHHVNIKSNSSNYTAWFGYVFNFFDRIKHFYKISRTKPCPVAGDKCGAGERRMQFPALQAGSFVVSTLYFIGLICIFCLVFYAQA